MYLLGCADSVASNNKVILASELAADTVKRGPHLACGLRLSEINRRFIPERGSDFAHACRDRSFNSCHDLPRDEISRKTLFYHRSVTILPPGTLRSEMILNKGQSMRVLIFGATGML